ncbi:outer membrane assembly lipoprotein YfgL [Rhodoferax ferrireducens]|uniref:Outer membrane protein assembly factor BamB n=1 Tax=Rhodoferax ferrireducens TaxID=192843 RepID=A0ABU2C616_9BURK|nr:outer membrane protein assembly factor BamB [Rhodoferax ferrireducens]MDR7376783.1 outer membrane assembly lipoprotein YfgL [Rhodoferax ferrireducens]
MQKTPLAHTLRATAAILLVAALAACSSTPDKPKPADLPANVALLGVRQAWVAKLGEVGFPLEVNVNGGTVALATGNGTVLALDARTGRELWRTAVGASLSAGVGSDGKVTAVVTRDNEVIALESGKVLWRQRLGAQAYTAPLVAGGRVFVLAADRSVSAFDGQTGRKLWNQQRSGEALVLGQSSVLLAVGDTLVSGVSGRLVGMNPTNGSTRWEAPIAAPRGTNDVERLVDLVGRVSRVGDVVCARAFLSAVGCVDAARGRLLWTKPAQASEGVHGNEQMVFGTESDGKVIAWRRENGEQAWVSERLRYRSLSAPLAVGRSVAVGDGTGLVHFLSREDGSPLTRMATDGSAIVTAPVLAGDTVVVVTQNGGIYGFQPE